MVTEYLIILDVTVGETNYMKFKSIKLSFFKIK